MRRPQVRPNIEKMYSNPNHKKQREAQKKILYLYGVLTCFMKALFFLFFFLSSQLAFCFLLTVEIICMNYWNIHSLFSCRLYVFLFSCHAKIHTHSSHSTHSLTHYYLYLYHCYYIPYDLNEHAPLQKVRVALPPTPPSTSPAPPAHYTPLYN